MPGRHGGCDCRYYIVGLWDALHRITAPLPKRWEPRVYNHDHDTAMRAMRETLERYPSAVLLHDVPIEPGDVIVAKRREDMKSKTDEPTPQHVLVVGLRRGELWHCVRRIGVVPTSIGMYAERGMRIYRSTERELWH